MALQNQKGAFRNCKYCLIQYFFFVVYFYLRLTKFFHRYGDLVLMFGCTCRGPISNGTEGPHFLQRCCLPSLEI